MNNRIFHLALAIVLLLTNVCCKNSEYESAKEAQVVRQSTTSSEVIKTTNFVGTYVTEGYEERAKGYDWTAVIVEKGNEDEYSITVRSREDIKQPTCTFDATAYKVAENILKAEIKEQAILFIWTDQTLEISTEKMEDRALLSYYCSGGGSLAGIYERTNESLDLAKKNNESFSQTLDMNGITYKINTTNSVSSQSLRIEASGPNMKSQIMTHQVDGSVIRAEITDLNKDTHPELLVFTQSTDPNRYGSIIAYSSNRGKSISPIYFPEVANSPKTKEGYMGQDQFTIANDQLIHKFPIFSKEGSNTINTGKIREIHYNLIAGEASWQFILDQVKEYDEK